MDAFEISKRNAIKKKDKSGKGFWDERIRPLCNEINSLRNFFTTSSCSGRIVAVNESLGKIPRAFIFKSHEKINPNFFENLRQKNLFYFKVEPCALHVTCRNLDCALKFLDLARKSGWKKSGIFPSKHFFNCELFSTENLSVPIDLSVIKNKEYLRMIVLEANKKLEKTHRKIDVFLKNLISHRGFPQLL